MSKQETYEFPKRGTFEYGYEFGYRDAHDRTQDGTAWDHRTYKGHLSAHARGYRAGWNHGFAALVASRS